jgi:hypothetical protein
LPPIDFQALCQRLDRLPVTSHQIALDGIGFLEILAWCQPLAGPRSVSKVVRPWVAIAQTLRACLPTLCGQLGKPLHAKGGPYVQQLTGLFLELDGHRRPDLRDLPLRNITRVSTSCYRRTRKLGCVLVGSDGQPSKGGSQIFR